MINEAMKRNLMPEETARYCLEGDAQETLYAALEHTESEIRYVKDSIEPLLDALDEISSQLQHLETQAESDTPPSLRDFAKLLAKVGNDLSAVRRDTAELTVRFSAINT